MAMLQGFKEGVFTVCLGLAWLAWQASTGQAQEAKAAGDTMSPSHEYNATGPAETGQPMNPEEPMQGGMKKPGMMKGDVRKSAEAKDEVMKEKLEKEAESMPPMPGQIPRGQ
jgi:hypothetical protein